MPSKHLAADAASKGRNVLKELARNICDRLAFFNVSLPSITIVFVFVYATAHLLGEIFVTRFFSECFRIKDALPIFGPSLKPISFRPIRSTFWLYRALWLALGNLIKLSDKFLSGIKVVKLAVGKIIFDGSDAIGQRILLVRFKVFETGTILGFVKSLV